MKYEADYRQTSELGKFHAGNNFSLKRWKLKLNLNRNWSSNVIKEKQNDIW